MTERERILAILHGKIPDRVPCVPDISNMVPCRLTGKPFWDIYLYQNPPLWKAYIDAAKHLGTGGFLVAPLHIETLDTSVEPPWTEAIIERTAERIVTRSYRECGTSAREWKQQVNIYDRAQPATHKHHSLLGLPERPERWEPVEGVRQWPKGEALLKLIKDEMGEQGFVSVRCGTTMFVASPEDVYAFHDDPEPFYAKRDRFLEYCEKRMAHIFAMQVKPDFITMGASGTLVFQSVRTFRELGLPVLKRMTELCRKAQMPSHVHACGPETALVRIAAEETDLTLIDPLEIPPMGDCNLRELKQKYGGKIGLKGNLHTTDVMLRGTFQCVLDASRQAILDAAEDGGFILSTGDQCGRDTPMENFHAMIEACDRWGRY